MNIAVRFYTKTGNTERLAKALAEAVGAEALPLSRELQTPLLLFTSLKGIPADRKG